MTELKFRFWDRFNRNMFYQKPHQLGSISLNRFFHNYSEHEQGGNDPLLMHYTGLKDYSVLIEDIYEGDILLCNEQGEYLEVFYSDGAFRIQFSFEDESTVLTEKIIKANRLIKVGNICENPEKLEDQ